MSLQETSPRRRTTVRRPVLLGLFAGTTVGVGYLLAGVPNFELMTLLTALAGGSLGLRSGVACGMIAAVVYSLGSPYGLPAPLLLAAQAAGLGWAGAVGAVAASRILEDLRSGRRGAAAGRAAGAGLIATVGYEAATNGAILFTFELEPVVVLAGAVPFFLLHVGTNLVLFGLLAPGLLARLAGLSRQPLVGGPMTVLAALLLLGTVPADPAAGQTAPADSAAAVATGSAAADSTAGARSFGDDRSEPITQDIRPALPPNPLGWQRSVWEPFFGTAIRLLDRRSDWVPVVDGNLGGTAMILGEATTSPAPLFLRDGVPVGTGHALADDPWLVMLQGAKLERESFGDDGWGRLDGTVELVREDPQPDKAVSVYRGVKGPHETYMRGVSLLTPRAAWRLAFDFEESLDNEAWNYTDAYDEEFAVVTEFPGHSRLRSSRTSLTRQLDAESSLTLHYTTGRKTKDTLPVLDAEHQEVWDSGVAVRAIGRTGDWRWRSSLFWNSRDVQWGDRAEFLGFAEDARLLETGREGISFAGERAAGEADLGLSVFFANWEVEDTGVSWFEAEPGGPAGEGREAGGSVNLGSRLAGGWAGLEAGLDWDSRTGSAPAGAVSLATSRDHPWCRIETAYGGRAPRSDEWLTPVSRSVDGGELRLLPNPDLQREKTLRAAMLLQGQALGLGFALDGSWRLLRDGITWLPAAGETRVGTWQNDLEMAATRWTASVRRQGRLLGWARAGVSSTWQTFDEREGRATFLPPESLLRWELMWENHFFGEDGILQIALLGTRRAAMSDPWDVTRAARLPAASVVDLLLGFRLVGAHISLAMRNLTDQEIPLSSGSTSRGREMDLRLRWMFFY